MKASIKTDFEKWLITKLTKEAVTNKYYLTVGSDKLYVYFEGQEAGSDGLFVNVNIVPVIVERVSTGAKFHKGFYRFYIYANTVLIGDKVVDALSTILDEQNITVTGSFHLETEVLSTFQRGNKFASSPKYETICDLNFYFWETL